MTSGDKIKEIRQKRGLTQDELAQRIGIKRGTLAQYEANRRQPKLETLKKFAQALDVPWYELSRPDSLEWAELVKFLSENSKNFSNISAMEIYRNFTAQRADKLIDTEGLSTKKAVNLAQNVFEDELKTMQLVNRLNELGKSVAFRMIAQIHDSQLTLENILVDELLNREHIEAILSSLEELTLIPEFCENPELAARRKKACEQNPAGDDSEENAPTEKV